MGRKLNQLDQFRLRDEHHPRNERYGAEEHFTGTLPERTRTDRCNILTFIVVLLGVVPLAALSCTKAQFYRLTGFFDFRADHCGRDQLTAKPYFYMVDPINHGSIGICVDKCPDQNGLEICFYDTDGVSLLDDYCFTTYTTYNEGHACAPAENAAYKTLYESFMFSPQYLMRRAAGDLFLTYDIIFIGFAILLLVGLLFLLLLMITVIAKFIIFLCFAGFFALGGYTSYLFHLEYKKLNDKMCPPGEPVQFISFCAGTRGMIFFILPFIFGGVLAIVLVYFLVKIKSLITAIRVINETLKPLRNLCSLLLVLIVFFLLQLAGAFGLVFLWICMMAAGSVETVKAPTNFPAPNVRTVMTQPWQFFCTIYLGFFLLWWLGLCIHIVKYIVASAVSTWYFSREKSILDRPIGIGLRNVCKYHIGTIVYGSLIITFTWPLKRLMGMIRKRLDKANIKSKSFRFCLVCWSCLLTYYEQRLKYVSSRNYIQTAIFGDDFVTAGERMYYLQLRNESRLIQVRKILGFILVVGKGIMIFAPVFVVYFWLLNIGSTIAGVNLEPLVTEERLEESKMEFSVISPLLVLVVGLYTSQIFAGLPDLITEALIMAFICDEEMFTGKQRFATPEVKKFMDSIGKEADRKNELEVRFYKKREEDEFKPAEETPIKVQDHSDLEIGSDHMSQRLRPDSAGSGALTPVVHTQEQAPFSSNQINVRPNEVSHDSDAEEDEDEDEDDAESAINSQKNNNKNLLAGVDTGSSRPVSQNSAVNNTAATKLPPLQMQRPTAPMNNNLMTGPMQNESDEDEDEDEDDEESEHLSPQKQPVQEEKKEEEEEEEEEKDNHEIEVVGVETKKSEQNFEDSEDEEDIDRNTKNNAIGNVKQVQNFTFDF